VSTPVYALSNLHFVHLLPWMRDAMDANMNAGQKIGARPAVASFSKKSLSRTNLSSRKVSVATTDWPAGDFSDLLCAMNQTVFRQLRTLLALGRVSHLPTVWSNCLAGWWLGGGGNFAKLPLLFLGVSALYTGGMFLNDAFDADFDRQRRAERPIPSGAISLPAVWRWGLAWLGLGALCLTAVSKTTGVLTLVLLLCIIIYDATHKVVTASPWLMGLCRFWVYVIAGSTGAAGVNGGPIWCGVAVTWRSTKVPGAGFLIGHWRCWRRRFFRHVDELGGISRSSHVVVARARAVDRALCADNFSAGTGQCRAHCVGPAGGNCFRGLAGGRAVMPALVEFCVFDFVRRDAGLQRFVPAA
jgi:hypothetical protein